MFALLRKEDAKEIMCGACNTSPEFLTREGESRRGFLTASAAAAVAAPLAATGFAGAAQTQDANVLPETSLSESQVQSWAAFDTDGSFALHTITRRAAGPKDVVVEIMYSSICHSDIHTYKGDWGPAVYPLVPGHAMVGRVVAVVADVIKFREGDYAGVGTMVDSCGECANCVADREQNCLKGTTFTYGSWDKISGGVTHGGYSKKIVVKEDFALCALGQSRDLLQTFPKIERACAPWRFRRLTRAAGESGRHLHADRDRRLRPPLRCFPS